MVFTVCVCIHVESMYPGFGTCKRLQRPSFAFHPKWGQVCVCVWGVRVCIQTHLDLLLTNYMNLWARITFMLFSHFDLSYLYEVFDCVTLIIFLLYWSSHDKIFTNKHTKTPSDPPSFVMSGWWSRKRFASCQTLFGFPLNLLRDSDSVLSKGQVGFNRWIYLTMPQTGRPPAVFKKGVNEEWLCCLDRWEV